MNNTNSLNTKTVSLIIYAIILILIFLFPPIDEVFTFSSPARIVFYGWDFISYVGPSGYSGRHYQINVIYLLIEIGIATLIYIFFLYSQKK